MSGFNFIPAVREKVSLLIALAGPSGSGKTKSALLLAEGMSPNGKIAFVDTEARRGLHYADQHRFMHADMWPQFRPERFIEAIRAAEAAEAEAVIIDSFSHEYDGEGGILDWAADLERGQDGADGRESSKGIKPPGNWKIPKLAHKRMMNAILQCRSSIIFCLRADEKIEIAREEVDGSNGKKFTKTVVRPLGWMPICEKRFMYEMTASFTLTADKPGVPRFDLPHKLQDQHRHMFPSDRQMGREAGALLAAWARGEVDANAPNLANLVAAGNGAADEGMVALRLWWKESLSKAERQVLGQDRLTLWQQIAQRPADDDIDFGDVPDDGRQSPSTDARAD